MATLSGIPKTARSPQPSRCPRKIAMRFASRGCTGAGEEQPGPAGPFPTWEGRAGAGRGAGPGVGSAVGGGAGRAGSASAARGGACFPGRQQQRLGQAERRVSAGCNAWAGGAAAAWLGRGDGMGEQAVPSQPRAAAGELMEREGGWRETPTRPLWVPPLLLAWRVRVPLPLQELGSR